MAKTGRTMPLPDATVFVAGMSGDTDANGLVVFSGVQVTEQLITVEHPNHPTRQKSCMLKEAAAQRVVVHMKSRGDWVDWVNRNPLAVGGGVAAIAISAGLYMYIRGRRKGLGVGKRW